MAQIRTVTPNNLGKTIKANALEANKYDVALNVNQLEAGQDGAIGLKESFVDTLKAAGVADAVLDGSDLKLTLLDGSEKTVPLAGLVPAAKADHFLKNVMMSEDGTKVLFVVGAAGTEAGQSTVEFSLDQVLLNADGGAGLKGNGSTTNPYAVKIDSSASSALTTSTDGIKLDPETLGQELNGKVKPVATVELQDAFGEHICWAFTAIERVAE